MVYYVNYPIFSFFFLNVKTRGKKLEGSDWKCAIELYKSVLVLDTDDDLEKAEEWLHPAEIGKKMSAIVHWCRHPVFQFAWQQISQQHLKVAQLG